MYICKREFCKNCPKIVDLIIFFLLLIYRFHTICLLRRFLVYCFYFTQFSNTLFLIWKRTCIQSEVIIIKIEKIGKIDGLLPLLIADQLRTGATGCILATLTILHSRNGGGVRWIHRDSILLKDVIITKELLASKHSNKREEKKK